MKIRPSRRIFINGEETGIVCPRGRFESLGFKDLVSEYKIPTTRTSLYKHAAVEPFADYVLASPELKIVDFKVLPDEVSDHAALFTEIEL